MDKVKIDWPTIITDSYNLAYKINQSLGRPEVLVFLGRGALMPASIVSNVLGIKDVFNLGMRSYEGTEQTKTIKIIQNIDDNKFFSNKHVLVLDELSDTGNTLYMAKNILDKDINVKINYATLYIKHKTSFIPDVFIKGFDEKIWLDFPWESDNIY